MSNLNTLSNIELSPADLAIITVFSHETLLFERIEQNSAITVERIAYLIVNRIFSVTNEDVSSDEFDPEKIKLLLIDTYYCDIITRNFVGGEYDLRWKHRIGEIYLLVQGKVIRILDLIPKTSIQSFIPKDLDENQLEKFDDFGEPKDAELKELDA